MPDVHAGLQGGLLELNLIEEPTLESLIHVLSEVGGGNHDAIKILHLLKNDVLDGVLHLINWSLCSFLAFVDDGISLIKEQDWGLFALLYLISIGIKETFDVFLAFAHPAALDFGDINL